MLETSYTDAEKLASDIVQTLLNNGFDEAGKSRSFGGGPATVTVGNSAIKLIESDSGKVTVNEDGLDWKMLDPQVKNIIHGVATASSQSPPVGDSGTSVKTKERSEKGIEKPDSRDRDYLFVEEANEDSLSGLDQRLRNYIGVYEVSRESATGEISKYGIVDTSTGSFDANITTAINEDGYVRYLVIMDDMSQISFYNDNGVLHADEIHIENGDEEVLRGVFMLNILMEYAGYLGLTKISGEISSSTTSLNIIDKAGVDTNGVEVNDGRAYFETDAF